MESEEYGRDVKRKKDPAMKWVIVGLLTLAILWPAYAVYRFNKPRTGKSEGPRRHLAEYSGVAVEMETYGSEWPFPNHASGRLDCKARKFGDVRRPLVIIQLGEKWYGLNGAAIGVGGYPDAKAQMAKHSEWGTYELGATNQLIQEGLQICGF